MFDLLKKKIGGFIDNIVGKTGSAKPEPLHREEPVKIEKPAPETVSPPISEPEKKEPTQTKPLPLTRSKAWELVQKYNSDKSDFNHYLESEAVMRALARRLGEDEDYWGMLGLVHDIDWGMTKNDAKTHLTKMPGILRDAGFDQEFITAALSHGYGFDCAGLLERKRSRKIEHALACAETVTGLVHAYALMRNGFEGMEVKGLRKKFKDASFAASVRRDIISECEQLGIPLDEFLQLAIDAITGIADRLYFKKKEISTPTQKTEAKTIIITPKPPEPMPKEFPKPRTTEEKSKDEPRPKVGLLKQVTSIFTGEVEISESEVRELLDTLELELLESDVAIEVADEIKNDLRKAMVDHKIKRGDLNAFVKNAIRNTLVRIVKSGKEHDIVARLSEPGTALPLKILFLGVNGAGKTTTMAKVAKMLMDNGKTVVFASADTFRAAAIEQLQVHADRLGVRNIKRDYGSDPTAVAYDAVNYAKAHNIDAVLIDTAGRQETDLNLINELKKISRVIQPDLKFYIGESIAGNAILGQVEDFNKAIGIDGVILTKLDCDAKGGTVLSITKATGIPVSYVGTGQRYEDLEKFDAEKIVERILE